MEKEVENELRKVFDEVLHDVLEKMENTASKLPPYTFTKHDCAAEELDEYKDAIAWSILHLVSRKLHFKNIFEALSPYSPDNKCFRLGVDFDGVVVENGHYPEIGPLLPGAKETLQRLRDAGYYIIIWSCRWNPFFDDADEQYELVRQFLDDNNVPYAEIAREGGKILVNAYIDDLAIEFRNWKGVERLFLK